uniref:ATP synthase complex subunit 8 n=1 Tax=Promalactis odaiensis TaxID=1430642 RepID=A0A6G7IV25_9NEOP|nr:ATP synthase F0 subunit 8 [Promalactis odaiensis]
MPQMMPINWLISLFIFIGIFFLFNILNYFIFNNNNNMKFFSNKINKTNNFNWKW